MAVINFMQDAHNKACLEKYKELKKFICAKDDNGKINDYYPALEYIQNMENKIEKQQKELEKYKSFFKMLKSFIPRDFSANDNIG